MIITPPNSFLRAKILTGSLPELSIRKLLIQIFCTLDLLL